MGQTLTHGVYLPDEGERNCYNGLASNWSILDGAVGTVAEHTSQIAGKAPAVHTHTVSQITDFPAYGNAAGTICEGNDSRLSDARTPVAHTHTKSDVTDLLNSNFIPSANNSYDLGSSSKQWLNTYSKGYYYNGVAWGLDKANVWSDNQTVLKNSESLYVVKRSNLKLGDPIPQTTQVLGTFAFTGSDGANAGIVTFRDGSNGDTSLIILARQRYNSNGDRDPSGFQYETRLDIGIDSSRNYYIRPNSNGDIDLGTSTKRWKSLNGVNPGALSLPVTALNNTYDISGNITDLTGGNNAITAARTGWIFVKSDNATEISIANTTTGMGASDHSASATTLMVSIPVTSGETLNIIVNCTSLSHAYLLPCQGNV